MGPLECNIDSGFASVSTTHGEILIAGANYGPGAIWKVCYIASLLSLPLTKANINTPPRWKQDKTRSVSVYYLIGPRQLTLC
jgi:hypothetical protein